MNVGYIIKKARAEKGLTQEELAEKVGVKKSAVAKWENGRVSEIKRSNLKNLADVLGLAPTQLLGDVESNPIEVADELADIYLDPQLRALIADYRSLSKDKQAQARSYIQFLRQQG